LHIRFEDHVLRRLAAEPAFAPEGWDEPEIRHFRLVAQCAQAAQVADDLHATRVLRIRPCADGQPGTWFVQLSSSRRLLLAFGTDTTSPTLMFSVLSMEMEETR
jgi:toxin HigB-1